MSADTLSCADRLVLTGGEGGGRYIGGFPERQLRALVLSLVVAQRLKGFVDKQDHTILERLTEHLASGAVVPVIGRTVDLEHVPGAIRDLAAGRIAGKAAVVIRSA